MKRLFNLTAAMSIAAAALVTSCKDDMNEIATEKDGSRSARTSATILFGRCGQDNTITSDQTLTANNIYILQGIVRVDNGATLTIEPGTLILGECAGTLIIERGANIIAQGTPSAPIRFSSNKPVGQRRPGDWGGVIILGRARNTAGTNVAISAFVSNDQGQGRYGGTDDNDNSGIFRYVRIEYPGGLEINGVPQTDALILGSVGRGTQLDHVQVLYSQENGFKWFGGTVDAKYLYAFGCSDDDFDTDEGYIGRVQFAAGVKIAGIFNNRYAASNGFESNSLQTNPTFANVTLVGPCGDDNPAVFGYGVNGSDLNLYNSVISEWSNGVGLSCTNTSFVFTRISSDATNNYCPQGITYAPNVLPGDCPRVSGTAPNLTRNPDLGSTIGVPSSDGFFTTTSYRGAFSSTRANNDGWDLASENSSFFWLSFKASGN